MEHLSLEKSSKKTECSADLLRLQGSGAENDIVGCLEPATELHASVAHTSEACTKHVAGKKESAEAHKRKKKKELCSLSYSAIFFS